MSARFRFNPGVAFVPALLVLLAGLPGEAMARRERVASTQSAPDDGTTKAPAVSPREAAREAARKAKAARAGFDEIVRRAAPRFVLESEPSKRVEAVLTQEISVPDCDVSEWVLFAARPVDLPGQRRVEWEVDPPARERRELGPEERPVLVARLPVKEGKNDENRHAVTVRVTYRAELMSRHLRPITSDAAAGDKPRAKAVEAPAGAERESALAAGPTIDFDAAAFQDFLDHENLRPGPRETEMEFAGRAFRWVKESCKYDYADKMDRKASHVCSRKQSDCGGLSGLYVSVLRAAGIPARQLVGRWASSAQEDAKVNDVAYYQQHVKAEFFAAGVGWVPADLSSAVLWDKSADGLTFFGHDTGDFIAFHVDDLFLVDTLHFGKHTIPFLQGVGFWVVGDGKIEGYSYKTKWEVGEWKAEASGKREPK